MSIDTIIRLYKNGYPLDELARDHGLSNEELNEARSLINQQEQVERQQQVQHAQADYAMRLNNA